ncbi:MAG: hypothetical protein ACP5JG_11770, partial [Anaerolineae bacterium]
LWSISLFLIQNGASGLWWLLRPSASALVLLMVAVALRIGFYPFQVLYIQAPGRSRPLSVIGMLSPMMGIALLYRLMLLPGLHGLPIWGVAWACLSVFWLGLKAITSRRWRALVAAGYGVFLMVVAGALAQNDPELLMVGVATWIACMALLFIARRYDRARHLWSLPTSIAFAFLLGCPPSPLGRIYREVLVSVPWGWRGVFLLGLVLTVTALLQSAVRQAAGRVVPPTTHRKIALISGWGIVVGVLAALVTRVDAGIVSALSVGLWLLALAAGTALLYWGGPVRRVLQRAQPVVELLDMQWFYRTVWQGAEHLLSVLRIGAEVVEGSGSVLWSVLVLLLVLVVLGSV